MTRPVPTEFLTADEVADRLRTSVWVVVKACRDGRLAATKPNREWLITEEALAAYLDAHSNADKVAAS